MGLATLPVVQDGLDDAHEFLCARCAKRQETCCQRTDIVVTDGDISRVAAYTGQRDFIEFRTAGKPEYIDQDDDPLWRDATFLPDGTRRVVKHRENGDCTFLGSAGCSLPYETRPLICRLYPFEYSEAGVAEELASGCPRHLLPDDVDLAEALAMKREDAERWHNQLYSELRSDLENRKPS
jgi:Fe-S-cluster containining protein